MILTPPVLWPAPNRISRWLFLSLKASHFLLGSISPRSWRVEWDQLFVARSKGVLWCAILAFVSDGRINGMCRAGTNCLLEDCTIVCVCVCTLYYVMYHVLHNNMRMCVFMWVSVMHVYTHTHIHTRANVKTSDSMVIYESGDQYIHWWYYYVISLRLTFCINLLALPSFVPNE